MLGGAVLYALGLPQADELVLDEIDADLDGDAHFPEWPRAQFRQASSEPHATAGGVGYRFNHYVRQQALPTSDADQAAGCVGRSDSRSPISDS